MILIFICLFFHFSLSVSPSIKNQNIKNEVLSSEETRELYCELERGNPLPTFIWEEQPYPCSSSRCIADPGKWEPVKKVCYLLKYSM